MTGRRGAAPAALLLASVTALVAAGCGSSHRATPAPAGREPTDTVPSSPAGSLRIAPRHPATGAAVAFTFRAPVASGVHGNHVTGYSLSVVGLARPGCVGAHEANALAVAAGADATVRLGPAQLGGSWCTGHYVARMIELQRAHCTGDAPCPQYVRVVAIVARGDFRVTRG